MSDITLIFDLPEDELKWWKATIQGFRNNIVRKPSYYVFKVTGDELGDSSRFKDDISSSISTLRENCWNIYLKDEVNFHKEVISHLVMHRDIPRTILEKVIENNLLSELEENRFNQSELFAKLSLVVGDFAGRIMPYIYQLSLSTTNSRRSRAGSTFEALIDFFITRVYNYPYENQAVLGTKFYSENGVGKMVDGVIPSRQAYEQNRSKCLIITMKTTLRERWQEVVEELNRTNIPHIYLLTLDEGLTEGVLIQMKSQNITVVTYHWIKTKYENYDNVIDFDTLFKDEIPHTLNYWTSK
ncbi:type II restriction endonuclease [Roseivirga sp. E12]|uniref:type II restriction endonuclease n=1 Tax=Roseivirga sp. E12 TaxID=2819237 RepID=UPI001ABD13B2|nr:type II restriction endonuclease [Roseivirga sp. E12]MBO3700196.1 hypothetical protein [Roseivirga sp. E12]